MHVMAILRGSHLQASTGRRLSFRVDYEPVSDREVFYSCYISEPSEGMFGSLEQGSHLDGTVLVGPDCVPVELAIRSRVLSHIERTDFGLWRPPPPSWIGWYGPL
jgi:hypothetical protein